jgi:hypothetical protein
VQGRHGRHTWHQGGLEGMHRPSGQIGKAVVQDHSDLRVESPALHRLNSRGRSRSGNALQLSTNEGDEAWTSGTHLGPHVKPADEQYTRPPCQRTRGGGRRPGKTRTPTSWGSRGRRFKSCRPDGEMGGFLTTREPPIGVSTCRNSSLGDLAGANS